MQDGGKKAWSGTTCHKDNENGGGDMHNTVSFSEYIEVMLYDILVETNAAVSYHPMRHYVKEVENALLPSSKCMKVRISCRRFSQNISS